MLRFALLFLLPTATPSLVHHAAPEMEEMLAHDIYKEPIEIRCGFTTGATTPVAEAAAPQLRGRLS